MSRPMQTRILTVNCRVDCVLCHGTVRGPLAASDCDQIRRTHVHDVVTRQRLCVALVGVTDQRPNATPRGQNVSTTHLHILVQIVLDLGQDELDLILGRDGSVCDVARGIRGAGNRLALPWQEEDDATIRCGRIQQTHLVRAVVPGQDDVHT